MKLASAPATVRWPAKRRALFALAVPLCLGLAHWSRVTENEPSENAARLFLALAVGALIFQAHLAFYRLEATTDGLVERRLWGTRRVAWQDVRAVELIAQQAAGEVVTRWHSAAPDAFHIVIHTADGHLSAHRWMSGTDGLLRVLADRRLLEGGKPAKPMLTERPTQNVLAKAEAGLELAHLLALALPFSCLFGLVASLGLGLHPTANPLVDAALLAPAPWVGLYLVYRWVSSVRARRFGAASAKPPISLPDALLCTMGAVSGPPLLYSFGTRLSSRTDLLLLGMGLVFCWFPIATIRRVLREK